MKLLADVDTLLLLTSCQQWCLARHTTPSKDVKISTPTQLHEIVYSYSQDMLVLSFVAAWRYYNCCADGSTSPGNYGSGWYSLLFKVETIHYSEML
jgi:hypothetical protein